MNAYKAGYQDGLSDKGSCAYWGNDEAQWDYEAGYADGVADRQKEDSRPNNDVAADGTARR